MLFHFCIACNVTMVHYQDERNTPMRMLVIDSDKRERSRLAEMLSGLSPGADIVGLSDRAAYLALDNKNIWDAAFLETELTDCSGIDLACEIKTGSPRCNIIFVTSFPQHSLEAYRARPSGFVLKPFDEAQIRLELEDLRYPAAESAAEKQKVRAVTFGALRYLQKAER